MLSQNWADLAREIFHNLLPVQLKLGRFYYKKLLFQNPCSVIKNFQNKILRKY